MSQTVKIYKVTCTEGYQMSDIGSNYSLKEWGNNTIDYKGYNDEGTMYQIPEGYSIGVSEDEQEHFYNANDKYVELVSYMGRPALDIGENTPRFLKKA